MGVRQSDATVCAAALRPTGTHVGQAESFPELQRGFRLSLRDSVALGTKLSWATWSRQKDPWVRQARRSAGEHRGSSKVLREDAEGPELPGEPGATLAISQPLKQSFLCSEPPPPAEQLPHCPGELARLRVGPEAQGQVSGTRCLFSHFCKLSGGERRQMKLRCEHNHIARVRCSSRDGLSSLRTIPRCTNNRTELILPAGAATAAWFCFVRLFGLM